MAGRCRRSTLIRALFGTGLACLILPGVSVPASRDTAALGTALPAAAIALAALAAGRRFARGSASGLGGVIVAGTAWLFSQARSGAMDWLLAAELGVGLALAWPRAVSPRDQLVASTGLATAAALAALAWFGGAADAQIWGGPLCGLALVGVALLDRATRTSARRHLLVGPAAVVSLMLMAAWIGANSPSAIWFGTVIPHGPRDRRLVALTFDDGPNATATLPVMHILDQYGAKGTFFLVGKALDQRPDIARALLADGQLLGNHSYHHDSWRWLDPRYPELERTQQTFRRELAVCPTLFRPPHGQHTPFTAWVVHRHGMRTVTWDVSVGDWATTDAAAVADEVLARVHAGSIIDLHDGLDGNVTADRSVVVRALPIILAGLRSRGLRSVTLSRLLAVPGYTDQC